MARQGGPRWQRLLLAVAVALAVVGMHHLASPGCGEPVAHHGSSFMAGAELMSDSPQGEPDSDTSVQDMTPGLACLALLVAIGVVFRVFGGVVARRRDLLELKHEARVIPRIEDPPDLHILSISRT